MSYDMVKFERGQVWHISFKDGESVGHEQNKNRPWLVLSISKYNHSSGMITCVPITSRDRIVSPSQVIFTNLNNHKNVIMCEGIRSFDTCSGNYIFNYMGTLSDDVMHVVDCAISVHLGMHYSPVTLDKLYASMESILEKSKYLKELSETPKFTDKDVSNFAEKLQNLAEERISSKREEDDEAPVYNASSEESLLNPVIPSSFAKIIEMNQKKDITSDSPVDHTEKKSRIKWTKETCQAFIKDAENLPMKEVMEKWSISKKPRFYSMKNYVQSLLVKMS